jgi:hypothetical protein
MQEPSFREWLENRTEDVPDATTLALLIARSGAAGISHHDLCRLAHISPDTLEALLAALITAGQITVSLRNGQRVFRVAMSYHPSFCFSRIGTMT